MLKVDADQSFFSYGYNKDNSTSLYSYCKERIPNEVTTTSFKIHLKEIINKRRNNEEFLKPILLPSTHYGQEGVNYY